MIKNSQQFVATECTNPCRSTNGSGLATQRTYQAKEGHRYDPLVSLNQLKE